MTWRLAGQKLMQYLGQHLPQDTKGWIAEVAPNLIFAGMSAATLPEGTDPGLRAGAFAEDLLTSVPMGLLGRMGGSGLAHGIGRMRGRALSSESTGLAQMLTGTGLETSAMMSGLMPRPFATKAFEDYQARVSEEEQQRQAIERQEIERQAIEQMGGLGALVAPLDQAVAPGIQLPFMGYG